MLFPNIDNWWLLVFFYCSWHLDLKNYIAWELSFKQWNSFFTWGTLRTIINNKYKTSHNIIINTKFILLRTVFRISQCSNCTDGIFIINWYHEYKSNRLLRKFVSLKSICCKKWLLPVRKPWSLFTLSTFTSITNSL